MLSPDMFGDRSIFRRVGFYMLLFVAVGIGGGSLVYTSIMQSLGWPVQGGSNAFSFLGTRNAPALVLYSAPNSQKYFSSVGANYQVLLEPWRVYAKSRGLTLREINSLGADGPEPGSVLVLASAVALDASERASLARYKSKGGSLLITWATGSRDERDATAAGLQQTDCVASRNRQAGNPAGRPCPVRSRHGASGAPRHPDARHPRDRLQKPADSASGTPPINTSQPCVASPASRDYYLPQTPRPAIRFP